MRKLPEGHPPPQRPHWKHGRYWYVYRNQWEPLSRTHTEAISAWSIGVNPQAGMTELVDSVLIAIEKRDNLTDAGIRFEQEKTGARVLVAMAPELQDVIAKARSVRGLMWSRHLFHLRGNLRLCQTTVVEGPRMRKTVDNF